MSIPLDIFDPNSIFNPVNANKAGITALKANAARQNQDNLAAYQQKTSALIADYQNHGYVTYSMPDPPLAIVVDDNGVTSQGGPLAPKAVYPTLIVTAPNTGFASLGGSDPTQAKLDMIINILKAIVTEINNK